MKKSLRIAVFMLIVLSMVLTACGAPATPAPQATEAPATEAPAPTEAMTEAPMAEPAGTEEPAAAEPEAEVVETATQQAEATPQEPVNLVMWWWGEQEAPGAQAWLDETIALYQEQHPNVTIEAVLQGTDTLYPSFYAAAAAGEGPDIQYFWAGVWTLESAWSGDIVPISDYIPEEEYSHYMNNVERAYDGKIWSMPWYMIGSALAYNPDLYAQAGIDAPPETWDELIADCGKLNDAGIVPMTGGLKDMFYGAWLFSFLARQPFDDPNAFMEASVGQRSFTDPGFEEYWTRLNELKEAGCWNKDINSLDYQQGMDAFVRGEAAMTLSMDVFFPGWAETMGWDKLNLAKFPKYADGKMANDYVTSAQGLGITSWSQHKQEAADFLMFMHEPDRLVSWFEYTGVMPADNRLDPSIIDQPELKQIYEWMSTSAGITLEDVIPSILDEQGYMTGAQLLFSGDATPQELAQNNQDVIEKWREQSPDEFDNFKSWLASGEGTGNLNIEAAATTTAGSEEPGQEPSGATMETFDIHEPSGEPANMVMWWWGEQEAPGAQKWLDETVSLYQEANPQITVETVLQSTDSLIPAFQSAMAAAEGPDIQYFWGGVWTLEFAWGGGLAPIDDLIPADERAHYINNFERTYDGQIWGVPWYMSGNPFVYNPALFSQAGLDPSNPPKTWEELLGACDKLNQAGIIPISGGLKDGWFGGWLYSILSRQTHDSEKEYMNAVVGNASFTDPSFAEYWVRLNELKEAGCWNEDINSLDYQQGMDRFVEGDAAMIFGNDTFLAGWAEAMGGWDNIGLMLVPQYADGAMASQYVTTAQGLGITSWSPYKTQAAHFLMYMHTPERLKAWFEDTGVIPADDRLDPVNITIPQLKQVYEWDSTIAGPNMENFIPSMLDEQAAMSGAQLLFSGDMTPDELAQMTEDVAQKWREQDPDAVENFKIWAK